MQVDGKCLGTAVVVGGMLASGTLTTLMWKISMDIQACLAIGLIGWVCACVLQWQDEQCVLRSTNDPSRCLHYFEQPFWQTLTMFIGELVCFLVYVAWRRVGGSLMARVRLDSLAVGDSEQRGFLGDSERCLARDNINNDDDDDDEGQEDVEHDEAATLLSRSRRFARRGMPTGALTASVGSQWTVHADDSVPFDTDTVDRVQPQKPRLKGWHQLWIWVPAVGDCIATSLMNVGLLVVAASIYQMLRGTVVIFTGLLSVVWLKVAMPRYRVFAMIMVLLGAVLVGLSPILFPDSSPNGDAYDTLLEETEAAMNPVPSSADRQRNQALGVAMILVAQVFAAVQFTVEEIIMSHYETDPIALVGWEGVFGTVTMSTFMVLVHAFAGRFQSGTLFDILGGAQQLVSDGRLIAGGLVSTLAVGAFNFFGLAVTQRLSATGRTTIDSCRTLSVWLISLGLDWEQFKVLQIAGFLALLYGTFVYNRVLPLGLCWNVWRRRDPKPSA